VGIVFATIALAWLFHLVSKRIVGRLIQKTKSSLAEYVLLVARKPFLALILLSGFYLSALILPWNTTVRHYLDRGPAILIVLGIYALTAMIVAALSWYERRLKTLGGAGLAYRVIPWARILVVLLAGLSAMLLALDILGINTAPAMAWLGQYGGRILLIFSLSMMVIISIARITPKLVETAISRRTGESKSELKKRSETLSRVLVNPLQMVVIIIAILTILSDFINITTIVASFGIVGLAIGFGAQSLVKDLLAGLFVILENQYRVGDVATIAGVTGVVEDINLRRTVLRDLDGTVHFVPNGEVRVASNLTKDWARVNMDVKVAYAEDLKHVIKVINRVGKELAKDPAWASHILTPPEVLRVNSFGPSGIEIKITGDTKPASQWVVTGELRSRLKEAFDEEGISTPWPQTKVDFIHPIDARPASNNNA